ncbi:methyl-accepting chemotaxis protein [Azospirillum sp. sgz302134]
MTLQNLSITTKILAALLLMAALTVGTNLYSLTGMSRIDAQYSELIDQEAKATIAMARSNRVLADIGQLAYKMIAETDDAAMKRIAKQMDEEFAILRTTLADAKRLPEVRSDVERLMAETETTIRLFPDVQKATLANDNVLAMRLMAEKIEPAMAQTRKRIVEVTTDITGRLDKASDDATAFTNTTYNTTLGVSGLGIVLFLGLAYLQVRNGIVQPIRRTVAIMERLAGGDASVDVEGHNRKDEVGAIARTVLVFKQNLIRTREMEREAKEAEARAAAEKRKGMLDMASRFEQRVGGIVNAVGSAATELQATASQLAAAVEEVSAQCTAVAAASEQASANVQTVASASEEMSAAIRQLSDRVTRAAGRSKAAADGAVQAQKQLDALSGSIEQVDQIVAAINAVASQTNLLALNATIEAARAGEAGKGFAVVASEVKNLANQTHAMTEQIGSQIATVKGASDRTVDAMRTIIGQVEDIDHSTSEMAASVEQQSAATTEISRNAQQAAIGTSEVSRNVGGIQQAEGESSAATQNVKRAADDLAGQASLLKQEMDSFLSEIRAA